MSEYKTKAVFIRRSKSGDSVYIRNIDNRLGAEADVLIGNVSEVMKVLDGSAEWAKLGIIRAEEEEEENATEN